MATSNLMYLHANGARRTKLSASLDSILFGPQLSTADGTPARWSTVASLRGTRVGIRRCASTVPEGWKWARLGGPAGIFTDPIHIPVNYENVGVVE